MSALKDQLLKAGLVSTKQARRAGHEQRVDGSKLDREEQERRTREQQEELRRQQAAQREADQRRAQEAKALQEQRAQEAQARQRRQALVEAALREGRLEHWGGARSYFFADGSRVEFLQVNDDAARRLEQGHAAIARTQDPRAPYTLLQAQAARRLREVAPDLLVVLHEERAAP